MRFEEFDGREEICYLPTPLETDGVAGSDPEDGDPINDTPWGNLGSPLASGSPDQVIHLGTYGASSNAG